MPELKDTLVALEGERLPRQFPTQSDITITQFLELVVRETGRGDLVEVLVEDEDVCLDGEVVLHERITEFKLLHVASKDHIKVIVEYGQRDVSRDFRPSATMEKIIRWAIRPDELNVQAQVEDLQLKLGADVLPADLHLGQILEGKKEVRLSLVFKVKPQG